MNTKKIDLNLYLSFHNSTLKIVLILFFGIYNEINLGLLYGRQIIPVHLMKMFICNSSLTFSRAFHMTLMVIEHI